MSRRRRSTVKSKPKAWYSIRAQADDVAELLIFDAIGAGMGDGVAAESLVRELAAITAPTIRVRINSPGGDVFDAVAIYNALRAHDARIETRVEGLAASAASFVAMAGDRIEIGAAAMLMVHDPWSLAIGNAAELREVAALLDKLGETLAETYAQRSGKTVAKVRDLMAAETWFNGREAVAEGFADAVLGDDENGGTAAARARYKVPRMSAADLARRADLIERELKLAEHRLAADRKRNER